MESMARPSDVTIPTAAQTLTSEQVQLLASIGVYPVGPLPQVFRNLGMGTPQDLLNNLAGLAQIIPGDAGTQLKTTIEALSALLAAAQEGINLPILGNIGLPEISVPPMGPAGTIDQVASLEDSLATQAMLSVLKTALASGEGAALIIGLLGDVTGINTDAIETLVADLPLNVPGAWDGPFFSSAERLAIIPTWGLGGTNVALASPTFLNDPQFANTAVLAVVLRNYSRTGGGILSLLNPLSSTVGLNLSNADGTASHPSTNNLNIPITVMDGNVTVWDITAAYDLLSDAPSTILNPLAWLNSGVGAAAPTYLIPANITDFAAVLEDLTSGQIDIDTINTLLGTVNSSIEMFNVDVGADGNLYVTYDSGNLPLLEPLQFIPRTISYIPGFNISTPVSNSFEDVLTQLVAQGYQDVNMTLDAEGVATFVRGFDEAGTQAKFWQNPISWETGMETPQTVFNSIITGLQANVLNPEASQFEIFGNAEIGNLVYRNAANVAVAKVLSDTLEQLRDVLNPLMNDAQDAFRPLAAALEKATLEVNKVIDDGLNEVSKLGVNLSGPMLDANREVNAVSDQINNGIRGIIGLKPITAPPQFTPTPPTEDESALRSLKDGAGGPGNLPTPAAKTVALTGVTNALDEGADEETLPASPVGEASDHKDATRCRQRHQGSSGHARGEDRAQSYQGGRTCGERHQGTAQG